jgi:hypothetical protein
MSTDAPEAKQSEARDFPVVVTVNGIRVEVILTLAPGVAVVGAKQTPAPEPPIQGG